jgi:PAS domain S-box-containing protein
MIGKLTDFFLEKYMDADYLLQQKAKIFFAICIAILVGAIPLLIISNVYHQRGAVPVLSPTIAFFLLVIVLFILKRGHYVFSANLIVIIMFIGVWITIYIGDDTRHPIERVDTIVLILALLTYIPLMIIKQKSGIIIYFVINALAFIFFLPKMKVNLNIPQSTINDYFLDTMLALVFIGITSYQIFNISRKALDKAQIEIGKNRELNRNMIRNEENYRNLFENAQVGLFRIRIEDGKTLESNEQNAKMFGYESREEFIKDFIAKDNYVDPNKRQELLSILRRNGETKGFEAEFRRKDGSTLWVCYSAKLNPDRGWVEGVAEDITERKHAEEALHIQHRLGITLSGVTNLKEALFLILNAALKVINIDCGSVHILTSDGGFSLEYSVGLSDVFIKNAMHYNKDTEFATLIMRGKPVYINYEKYSSDREEWRSEEGLRGLAVIPVLYQNRVIACVNVASRTSYTIDNTTRSTLETIASQVGSSIQRLKAEEQIKDSLKEKEILLKEIHHRVKNNMQIISSLLNLQSRHVSEDKDAELFRDSQNRVHSMALVHEKLYKSEDLSRIEFAEYIRSLAVELSRTYEMNASMIKFDIHVKEVYLSVDLAIPCALIINELISNSLKYAFQDGREGIIRIEFNMLNAKEGDAYTLKVSDNGIGIPKDFDYRNVDTLGLELVNTLTKQLKGNIELDRSEGAKFTITF